MNTPDDLMLAADIEAAVRAVPGVAVVYRAGSTLSKAVDATTRLVGLRDEDAPLIDLERAEDGVKVRIAIGVHASDGAAATARRAHAAVQALLAPQSAGDADVHLTVVHVDGSEPPERAH